MADSVHWDGVCVDEGGWSCIVKSILEFEVEGQKKKWKLRLTLKKQVVEENI